MPRGGKRPGSGAPKGNFNALKTGRSSQQLNAVIFALAAVPQTRHVLLQIDEKKKRDRKRLRLVLSNIAKLLHNTELAESIKQKLEQELQRIEDEQEKR